MSGQSRTDADTPNVRAVVEGTVGMLVLDRPRALNALTHAMVTELHAALRAWAVDDAVTAVVVRGAGERGLCAGGDVVAVRESARADGVAARAFFGDEYLLDAAIARYPKPVVTLMDGIVMGGGVGVGAHAGTRLVTETSKVGMPEVGIGFMPDVGGTFLLSRAPGGLGLHAALTGLPFTGADAIAMGFADHLVAHDALDAVVATIVAAGVDAAVAAHALPTPPSPLAAQRSWIDPCFAAPTVAGILAALRAHDAPEAHHAAEVIAGRSPTALSVTLEAVRRAARLDTLEEALVQEYRTSIAALADHDFDEGIRAQLVDKDRSPRWSPATLDEVTDDDVARHFAPTTDEPVFPERPA